MIINITLILLHDPRRPVDFCHFVLVLLLYTTYIFTLYMYVYVRFDYATDAHGRSDWYTYV